MAVAQCLAPLSAMLKRESQRQDTVNLLLDRLSHGETYGDRKGAALGLAGVVKGMKIASVKKFVSTNLGVPTFCVCTHMSAVL